MMFCPKCHNILYFAAEVIDDIGGMECRVCPLTNAQLNEFFERRDKDFTDSE